MSKGIWKMIFIKICLKNKIRKFENNSDARIEV